MKQASLKSFKEFFSQGGSDCPTRELMPLGKDAVDGVTSLKQMQRDLVTAAEAAKFAGVYACVKVEEK